MDRNPIDSEARKTDRRARDVDDRIDSTDLVKVHLLERDPVHLGLCVTQRPEDRERSIAHGGVECSALENLFDFQVASTVVAVMVCARLLLASVLGDANLEVASRKRATFHLSHAQQMVELETAKISDERAPRQPGVEQRSQEHVSGNPRE